MNPYMARRPSRSEFINVRGLRYHALHWGDASLVTAQRPLSVAPDAVRLALDRSQSVKVVLTA